jgi:hypothetical protein
MIIIRWFAAAHLQGSCCVVFVSQMFSKGTKESVYPEVRCKQERITSLQLDHRSDAAPFCDMLPQMQLAKFLYCSHHSIELSKAQAHNLAARNAL